MDRGKIIEQILAKRGYKTVAERKRFLNPSYEGDVHDPYLLPDMDKAVKRIQAAVKNREKVAVYGDYDIDGLCASAVLADALPGFGLKPEVFIPNRFSDGYGLNKDALTRLAEAGTNLIITVDCGTSALEAIDHAHKLGLDIIVTDHHQPPAELPKAVAVVNPKRTDSRYPFAELAGCGVAFKLVQALQEKLPGLPPGQEKWLLDFVSFGTVCDVVPLTDENRALVAYGLKVWRQTRRPGFQALAMQTGQNLAKINTSTLGFIFGPRLNAAGRLVHAKKSLQLILAEDLESALPLAAELDKLNAERRAHQQRVETAAKSQLEAQADSNVLVVADADWPEGVVGIVAARLMEQYKKPSFVLQILDEKTKGSARSFGDFKISEALDAVRDLLITGGGHHAAGGFTLKAADINEFGKRLNGYYASLKLTDQSAYLQPRPDLTLDTLEQLTLELAADLQEQLAPFGTGNPAPLFQVDGLDLLDKRWLGADRHHLKLRVADKAGHSLEAIRFRYDGPEPSTGPFSLIGELEVNEFNGHIKPQLLVRQLLGVE